MKFKLHKYIKGGRYYIDVALEPLSEKEIEKSKKFGYPLIRLKNKDSNEMSYYVNSLDLIYQPYGFYTKEEAEEYLEYIKDQIRVIQSEWESKEDDWSTEEII